MSVNKEQYVVDESGNRTAVLLDVERYFELLEAQEELEAIRMMLLNYLVMKRSLFLKP
jgi:hypothetical protein